ncbi:cell division transport system permease protein [Streptoalloteichus tenebrarius]|uniref:Cell division protein FtsX n=1 Tax=Streptoalloteichus tenebrarius (strain ATCC 17920 / DSM 40477 / JCM 4838 / CBS 697.72 / NBRC 16177 / NCIMB 11028 / NRRL B-12390 / A12253. 1 / ISP 5477) TaxID=1933 RepID=A0ABT1HVW2_STRSD|nr:permease-like cell division protein FtsX [Streptoalloteichus tenebrarius]MCP2259661.1 cell division transport system permease protein [Streptoalloteichus tenebrarius]BFF00930.1 permease-like cell division protein FtsX [Streptoalloteichus tenebrarius]
MRASFVFSEVITGLRRNVTMTIAMILTTAISLGLLGGGLLVVRLIDKMDDRYRDKVEVSVYLNNDVSANDKTCAKDPCSGLRRALQGNSNVEAVEFESRDAAYDRFKRIFEGNPELVELARPEALPASFRVKLKDTQRFDALSQEFSGKPGVQRVVDQGEFLKRLFSVLTGVRNATFVIALVQALAALLLISNTIQLSAFTRRTEVGIMRLVGATRWYTQLPFLIEAVVAGLIGAVLAVGGLFLGKATFLDKVLEAPIQAGIVPKLGMADVAYVSPILILVAMVVSAITGYVTLRLYVRL